MAPDHVDPAAEPVTAFPPRGVPLPVSTQTWRDVVFLHWPYDPAALEHLAPAGTRLDVRDGRTWVGVVGLRLTGVRVGGLLRLPYLGDFNELNVRLYTVGEDGRRSTVFLAMEAERLPVVTAARALLRLPYSWAHVTRRHHDDIVSYGSRRRLPGPAGAGLEFSVRVGEPAAWDPVEDFFTARWGLHTPWYGMPLYLPFAHEPWPLRSAELLDYTDGGLLEAAGVPAPEGPPTSVLYAGEVHPRSGPPLPALRRNGDPAAGRRAAG
ncbi:YqjF family protein [Spirillospora sp. NPDC050679]